MSKTSVEKKRTNFCFVDVGQLRLGIAHVGGSGASRHNEELRNQPADVFSRCYKFFWKCQIYFFHFRCNRTVMAESENELKTYELRITTL